MSPQAEQGEGRDINAVKQRFMALNQERMLRTRSVLQQQQRLVFDAVPLLFHFNHPLLPGYCGLDVPAGIQCFQPADRDLQRLESQLAVTLPLRVEDVHRGEILSLFLMGSSGSLGQSERSDLDLWLCHAPTLSLPQRDLLRRKSAAISHWAARWGMELHVFLIDVESFRQGQGERLSAEAVGSSYHYLLLDEFYRSCILLAGRYPLWWLVPAMQERHYQSYVDARISHGDILPAEVIDFGAVPDIPAGEFIGAGIWLLYKAISSPYKALLKLLLIESYAHALVSENRGVPPLCQSFKQCVHDGGTPDSVDSYVMVYRHLENYLLSRGQRERLELVRRAFYFKAELPLTQAVGKGLWRRRLLQECVDHWQWRREKLFMTDAHRAWKMRRVRDEQQVLVSEFTRIYRSLRDFAEEQSGPARIDDNEMRILGRKLFAAFEQRDDKVDWINPGIVGAVNESRLYLSRKAKSQSSGWLLLTRPGEPGNGDAILHEAPCLTAMLCWCLCNRIVSPSTRIHVTGQGESLRTDTLSQLMSSLQHRLPECLIAADSASHDVFARPKQPISITLYLRLDRGRPANLSAVLSSGGGPYPVAGSELLVVNSWGEVFCRSFTGEFALRDFLVSWLQALLALPGNERLSPSSQGVVDLLCDDRSLQPRLAGLLARLQVALFDGVGRRYVVPAGAGFLILQIVDAQLYSIPAANYRQLLACLGRSQRSCSPIALDQASAPGSALVAIVQAVDWGSCSVFVQSGIDGDELYVVDERGSLFHRALASGAGMTCARQTLDFLHACRVQQGSAHEIVLQVLEHDGHLWRCDKRPVSDPPAAGAQGQISAVVYPEHPGAAGMLAADIVVGECVWAYREWGEAAVERAVSKLIADGTHHGELQIAAISLVAGSAFDAVPDTTAPAAQTTEYLRFKYYLETRLNAFNGERGADLRDAHR